MKPTSRNLNVMVSEAPAIFSRKTTTVLSSSTSCFVMASTADGNDVSSSNEINRDLRTTS